ncbi:protein involved in RimO-mediated beta-methylthiolation of ribosomal protein S12 YcaO [Novimethylophilus kurashikiensis]|uniref:Protein involved in RimO-mediated beta-methylthiolation of ribosomal protein S12 YcaO n=1 Tax=Novimethylophilus kurashikiensis TaxID=1825523 RepID=A0A2R5F7Q2_9PROT|nr:hypothetical protein [Novimethylophilus kurashikiensis]GBG14270.1 protein involved in RimO-mediated beta-methylthiolation of ribosomal protein S12 YcaO [Novimethylophilus kurashikiensis]
MTISSVQNVQLVKGSDVIEIKHSRQEGIKLPKFLAGGDSVKVVSSVGRCILKDARCMSVAEAERTVKQEVAKLAKQGWALVAPPNAVDA